MISTCHGSVIVPDAPHDVIAIEYREKYTMKEMLVVVAIVGVYLLLQTVILPRMGIST